MTNYDTASSGKGVTGDLDDSACRNFKIFVFQQFSIRIYFGTTCIIIKLFTSGLRG